MTECLQAVTIHVFPCQLLCRQKCYMRWYVWLTRDTSLQEFLARWMQLNNFLPFFLPFGGEVQKFHEDEQVEIIYAMIPKCWQSILLFQHGGGGGGRHFLPGCPLSFGPSYRCPGTCRECFTDADRRGLSGSTCGPSPPHPHPCRDCHGRR